MAGLFSNPEWAKAVLYLGVFGVPLSVGIAGYFWFQVRRVDAVTALKHELLNKGMSAEEIKTVVEAGLRTPESIDEVKRDMLDRGLSAEEIDKVIKAGQHT